MKKQFFFGKYYKFVNKDQFSFAIIDSYSDDGKFLQLILNNKSCNIKKYEGIEINDEYIDFDIHDEISIKGRIYFSDMHPLKSCAMGPFKIFSMECSHDVYSMYHSLKGRVEIDGSMYNFDEGYGYIEGDKGRSFPSRYVWYNSVGENYGVTAAIATIPFGFIHFTGLLCFIMIDDKEYRMCTYNFGKIKKVSEKQLIIEKADYQLIIDINTEGGHLLKAPSDGEMSRMIKENVAVKTHFSFKKGDDLILEKTDEISSLEYVMTD